MDSGITISLIFGISSIISSIFFGLIPNKRMQRITQLEAQREKLFQDILLFHDIEEELLKIIEKTSSENKISLQKKVRKIVSENNQDKVLSEYAKPSVYKKYIK